MECIEGIRLSSNQRLQRQKEKGYKSAVMTFDPHPSIVLGGRNEKVFYITPLQQKLDTLATLDIDTVFVVNFTSDFAKLSPEAFVKHFIRDLNVKHVTAGFDYSFGAFGKGDMELMRQLGAESFGVTVVDKYTDVSEKISSTRIRKALKDGDMEEARMLLGRAFEVPGIVVHGDKRGRTLDSQRRMYSIWKAASFRPQESMLSKFLYRTSGLTACAMLVINRHSIIQIINSYPLKYISSTLIKTFTARK